MLVLVKRPPPTCGLCKAAEASEAADMGAGTVLLCADCAGQVREELRKRAALEAAEGGSG